MLHNFNYSSPPLLSSPQNVWTAPLEAAAIIALLLSLTEVYGLPALGIVVFVLPLQYYFGYLIATYKHDTVEVSDARVLRMQVRSCCGPQQTAHS